MVFRHISEDVKLRALWLLDHDYIPEDVTFILGVSASSAHKNSRSSTKPFGDCGILRILSPDRRTKKKKVGMVKVSGKCCKSTI
jgi:hypothetical protein